jgi:cysteinyl-tRNA synthetase
MDIQFYNTLTNRIEPFQPGEPPVVTMYNCGPTVYDFGHIGNFRAFVFADVLRRFLELAGYNVMQVMNLTDVGHMTEDQVADGGGLDKMQLAGQRLKESKKSGTAAVENPDDPYQVAQFFIDAFIADAKTLKLKVADEYPQRMPRATQHIAKMQELIRKLIEKKHAYVASDGAVYYDVQSFPDYGKLSGNTLDKLIGGAGGRVDEAAQTSKKHPADFLLWKPDPRHIMKWDSPWGTGYPGWHIECSAMAMELLGREVIDIHTGGEDNLFPHHECEIAQTRGVTDCPSFARYWMHTRFLLVEGEKMSKSKRNFYPVRDVLEGKVSGKAVDPSVLRYELLKTHYRSNMNFTAKGLEDSASAVRRLRDAAERWERESAGATATVDLNHPILGAFAQNLGDDLNMSGALGVVFKWLGEWKGSPAESLAVLRKIDSVLGVLPNSKTGSGVDPAIEEKCKAIDAARAAKDFAAADRLRKEIQDAGYEVMTTKAGTSARKKLA